jgi:hypothetical protein
MDNPIGGGPEDNNEEEDEEDQEDREEEPFQLPFTLEDFVAKMAELGYSQMDIIQATFRHALRSTDERYTEAQSGETETTIDEILMGKIPVQSVRVEAEST